MVERTLLTERRKNTVSGLVGKLSEFGIGYNPVNYYYTPLTMYPRSLTPVRQSNSWEQIDMSGFNTMFYVHIPYCTTRCTFCPFYLDISKEVGEEYVDGLVSQLERVSSDMTSQPREFNVYFGGGSPNLLSLRQIDRLLEGITQHQDGLINEVSIELHPEIAGREGYLQALKDLGINRVSFGLQSINPIILRKTARHHDAKALDKILAEARGLGLTVNVDVIYGGFIDEMLADDEEVFNHVFSTLQPSWVTGYQMCVQEGTAEFERYKRENQRYPNSEAILSARALLHQIAEANGHHYLGGDYFSRDKSNPFYQERKWGNKNAVIALGSGAYSYVVDGENMQGVLRWAPFDTTEYLRLVKDGRSAVEREIAYTSKDVESWITMSQLKKVRLTDEHLSTSFREKLQGLAIQGFLERANGQFKLTERGILVEDLVYASLIPRTTWEEFRERRKKEEYPKEAKYDWFFEPETVLRFQEAVGIK